MTLEAFLETDDVIYALHAYSSHSLFQTHDRAICWLSGGQFGERSFSILTELAYRIIYGD